MDSYRLLLSTSSKGTRILLTRGPDELLKALLPPPSPAHQERAATRLLEALALWVDRPLRVALSADDPETGFWLGLTDEMGVGMRSVFYEVEVVEREAARRRRGIRIPGVGDFRDLRQLRLWCAGKES